MVENAGSESKWLRRARCVNVFAFAMVWLFVDLGKPSNLHGQDTGLIHSFDRSDSSTSLPIFDGRDIACRSAKLWLPSDILRARARTLVQLFCEEDDCAKQSSRSLARFLHMQADHQEDIGAASALRAYYTRIALTEQISLSEVSIALVNEEARKQEAIQEGGLAAGTDLSSFERHRIEIADKQLQIRSQDRQLRNLLAQLTKVDYEMNGITQERLDVFECPLDCDRLKQAALSQRQDIRGWIYLRTQVNEESAPIFAKMLTTIIGSWGLPLPAVSGLKQLLCPPDYSRLVANMRYELGLVVETHRQWICQAVGEKCAKLKLAYARVQLAQKTVESWQTRIAQLKQLEAKGDAQPEASATARSELLKARAEEISRRLDAKIAEVDLAESTGGLSDRCCAGSPWLQTGYE